jgi:hypothetical protein
MRSWIRECAARIRDLRKATLELIKEQQDAGEDVSKLKELERLLEGVLLAIALDIADIRPSQAQPAGPADPTADAADSETGETPAKPPRIRRCLIN